MLTITSSSTEESRKAITEYRSSDDCALKSIFKPGQEIWLRIKIDDPLSAEEFILPLLQNPVININGSEHLGFTVYEASYSGIGKIQDYKRELQRFIEEELEGRIKI